MGGVVKTVSNAVSDIGDSAKSIVHGDVSTGLKGLWNNPVLNPIQAAAGAVTGLKPTTQMEIGAGVGGAVVGARALGLVGGAAGAAGAAGAGTAGVAGMTSGTTAALGAGGSGVLASSGGIPLLTKVLLGASVASTLGAYFGVGKNDQDYRSWFNGLNEQDQAQVKQLEENLTSLQSNLDQRNAAVQKVVNDYPNVVATYAKAKQDAGQEFDENTKAVMNQVSNQLSAKYAATGGFNSGAFNNALSQRAGDVATARLGYMNQQGETAYNQAATGWQARLSEADALRSFQQKMLGQGVDQRFSAAQNSLQRQEGQVNTTASIDNQQQTQKNQAQESLFGSIGSTLGQAAMIPMYQQMFNTNRVMALPNNPAISSKPVVTAGVNGAMTGNGQ